MKFKAFYKAKWSKKPYPTRLRKSPKYKGMMNSGYASRTLRKFLSPAMKRAKERVARKKLIRKMSKVRTILNKSNKRKRANSGGWTDTPRSRLRTRVAAADNAVRAIAEFL